MKCVLKESLIKSNFDENKLSHIEPPIPEEEPSERELLEKHDEEDATKNPKISTKNDLKVIAEKKSLNILGKKNFEALDFVIQ